MGLVHGFSILLPHFAQSGFSKSKGHLDDLPQGSQMRDLKTLREPLTPTTIRVNAIQTIDLFN